MKWQEYYDRFWDWADSTRLRHIPSLTDFFSSAEVTEIAVDSCEDAIEMALVKRAISCGIRFTPEEVIALASLFGGTLPPRSLTLSWKAMI